MSWHTWVASLAALGAASVRREHTWCGPPPRASRRIPTPAEREIARYLEEVEAHRAKLDALQTAATDAPSAEEAERSPDPPEDPTEETTLAARVAS